MADLLLIFLGACLVNNLVLDHLVGVCPAATLSRRLDVALAIAGTATGVALAAAPLAYAIEHYLLVPSGLEHLELLTLVLIIAAGVPGAGLVLSRLSPGSAETFNAFAPLMTANCMALGVALIAVQSVAGLAGAVLFGLGAGAGFVLVILLLAGLQQRMTETDMPAPLRGAPALLLTMALLSMAFMGFTGFSTP